MLWLHWHLHTLTQAPKRQQANKHTHTNTHTGAHRLWRKPSPCKPTSLPMSGADLGQSWLMCPQLPGGFWSGGSNACSLTMNTNAECYRLLLPYSTLNGVIRITPRQCGWRRVNLQTQRVTIKTVDSLLAPAAVSTLRVVVFVLVLWLCEIS